MDTSKNGLIATGSWDQYAHDCPISSQLTDRTVIIWKEFKKAIKIEGHQQAVWAVKFIGEDRVLTGKLTYLVGNKLM
jgi:phospholipase A-2-activating protein